VVDYLLKPFGYEEFLTAALKARKLIEMESHKQTSVETNDDFLFIKSEYKIRRINFADILYVEGMKDYVKIYLKNEPKPVLSINSLKTLETKLPASRFMRCTVPLSSTWAGLRPSNVSGLYSGMCIYR
jgi:DNA-binding LytR/AlgR family response regulator